MSLVLIRGTKESAIINGVIVAVKVVIVFIFIFLGWKYINADNYSPYFIPADKPGHASFFENGWGGVIRAAGIVFFAYIGFDAVSTAAQEECKNPQRDLPRGMMWAIIIRTILYVAIALVLTGIVNYSLLAVGEIGRAHV